MEFSKEQIAELKIKHPRIHLVEVENEENGETYSIIVREPNRNDIARMKRLGNGNHFKENEILLNTIYLAGDKDIIIETDSLFYGVVEKITSLIKSSEATIKKL